jgi:hypothetical protein
MQRARLLLALLLAGGPVAADDEWTRYELLAPESHRFAISYDVSVTEPGARVFLNPVRGGSVSTGERVVLRRTGQELKFTLVKGAQARAEGLVSSEVKDDALFIRVELPEPVPRGGETRLRIFKTYADPKSYFAEGDRIVFDRGLSIRRNLVVLPPGYELVGSAAPGIVSTGADGRVHVSFVNDRDDDMPVRLVARRQVVPAARSSPAPLHRAEEDREITYWLLEPDTHQFRISHDFNVARPGQRWVHNFVRAGSTVSGATFVDLDTGRELAATQVRGRDVNALGYYPDRSGDDDLVLQGELARPLSEGQSVRVRVVETYTDAERYGLRDGELVWDRTLGRPRNTVVLPAGWRLTSLNVPAVVTLDPEGRVACRFVNPRPDELHVVLKARKR